MLPIKRPLYGILWFFVLLAVGFLCVGTGISASLVAHHPDQKALAANLAAIMQKHLYLIALPAFLIAFAGTVTGLLPGTKPQKKDALAETVFDLRSATTLIVYALIIQSGIGMIAGSLCDLFNVPLLFDMPIMQCTAAGLSSLLLGLFALGLFRSHHPSLFTFAKTNPFAFVLIPVLVAGAAIVESEIDNMHKAWLATPEAFRVITNSLLLQGWMSIVVIGLIAPLAEEIVFRGIVLGFFLKTYSPKKAVVFSALLFAILHMNPYLFVNALALGILLGWLYYATRNIYTCILFHSLYNLLSYAIVNNMLPFSVPGFTTQAKFQPMWFDMLGLALLISGLQAAIMLLSKHNEKPEGHTWEA